MCSQDLWDGVPRHVCVGAEEVEVKDKGWWHLTLNFDFDFDAVNWNFETMSEARCALRTRARHDGLHHPRISVKREG